MTGDLSPDPTSQYDERDYRPEQEDLPGPLGAVAEEGRGALPFALLHGEALVACAAWGMGEAGVTPADVGTPWSDIVEQGRAFVLHDALCPATPAEFIAECLTRAERDDVVVVGVRPVTDTVKRAEGGRVGETVDRDSLLAVASPIVLPPSVLRELDGPPGGDFAQIVGRLRERFRVELAEAPAQARRVASEDEVRLLEALTAPD